jgi:hypothetical protein
MAIRTAPRKEQRFDTMIRERNLHEGGVRSYVNDRISRGDSVDEIARGLAVLSGESFSKWTLYDWLERWRQEEVAA